ncbi:MAG: hypothetical protein V7K48_05225 [Nostoc sp.]|uniref:hypothetical protein n=1 Tax=Nostoc sp. TaxID=1180 RepID=UPI002FF76784
MTCNHLSKSAIAQNSNNAKANASNVPQQFHQKVVLTVGGGAIALLLTLLLIYPCVCKCFFSSGNFICSHNYFTECDRLSPVREIYPLG